MKTVFLDAAEQQELLRNTAGQGGFQGLIEGSQANLNTSTGKLVLTDVDLERIPRYAFDYGNGGFEGRLRRIFERHLGPNLNR